MSEPSSKKEAVFIGVHLSSDRVVSVAVSESGREIAESAAPYSQQQPLPSNKGYLEIQPEIWWDATRLSLGHLTSQLRANKIFPSQIHGLSVCGSPGALVILDRGGEVIAPAILRKDARATEQLKKLNMHGSEHCRRMGFTFQATDTIAKISWVKDNLPELYEIAVFVHQTDYILGRLKGEFNVTEYSTAMSTGCDLIEECWPDWLDYDMHLGIRERLPQLVSLGTPVGKLTTEAASLVGLPAGTPIVMGTTTETAAFLASGAKRMGDFSTNLDDRLSISGITSQILPYPHHLVKMFKLPGRDWFFSTETCTGADWIKNWFKGSSIEEIEHEAEKLLPTQYMAYPNTQKGETFPFCTNSAEGFISPATDNRVVQFASCLQGTGFFERMCYEKIDKLADLHNSQGDVYTAGPWSQYEAWMQCRADIIARVNHRPASQNGPAFGAAIIAALGSHYPKIETAVNSMVHIAQTFFPNPNRMTEYNDLYENFVATMQNQGYF